FVDNLIAAKITSGAIRYFQEIANEPDHHLRSQISDKFLELAGDIRRSSKWETEFNALKNKLLPEIRLHEYSVMIWTYIKKQLINDLSDKNSGIRNYLDKVITDISNALLTDKDRKEKTDRFVQLQAYKLVMRHKFQVSQLISNTIGNWKGRELSDKLELEVGKDLQFIRLNGTLVGGLVGLIIHTITHWFL